MIPAGGDREPQDVGAVAHLVDVAWQRMHWWVALMAVLYLAFGTPKVYVRDGSNSAGSSVRVPVIPR